MRATCGLQLKDRKRSTDLMLMLGLNESRYQLAMVNCVHWCGDVLRRGDCSIFVVFRAGCVFDKLCGFSHLSSRFLL